MVFQLSFCDSKMPSMTEGINYLKLCSDIEL